MYRILRGLIPLSLMAAALTLVSGIIYLLLWLGDLGYGGVVMAVFMVLILGWLAYDLGGDI